MGYEKRYLLLKDEKQNICGHVLLELGKALCYCVRLSAKAQGVTVHFFCGENAICQHEFLGDVIAKAIKLEKIDLLSVGMILETGNDQILVAGSVPEGAIQKIKRKALKQKRKSVFVQIAEKMFESENLSFFEAVKKPLDILFEFGEKVDCFLDKFPRSEFVLIEELNKKFVVGKLFLENGDLFALAFGWGATSGAQPCLSFEFEFFDCLSGEKLTQDRIISNL